VSYSYRVPKLWSATIEAHRQEVRTAVLEAASRLAADHGLRGVSMSRIAEQAGIGRATLYKYFTDVESILREWHDDQIAKHLEHLTSISRRKGAPERRLREVLKVYAEQGQRSAQHSGATDIVAALHAGDRLSGPEAALKALLLTLIDAGVESGRFRNDVPSDELAVFVLSAMSSARHLSSAAALERLLDLTLQAIRR
jgi:AcrR family transcriptional regulator